MLEDLQKKVLEPILASLREKISECLGSPWRVVTIRSWETDSRARAFGPNAWHTDGMPTGVYKIMYYPYGVGEKRGTVELQLAETVHSLEGPPGTWMVFKNSEVVHRGICPQEGKRLVIEITIVPDLEYDLRPISAGQNARHPTLPWQQILSPIFSYPKEGVVGVNIGGGPSWNCSGWVNLEEVPSVFNPTPFHLYPNCRFPFIDQSIKNIYTSHALEHLNLPTIYRVLSEAYRILEAEGNFIIKIPDYDKALDAWRKRDGSFFGFGWNIEEVIPTWKTRGLYDCLDYRAAMIFCSFFNHAHGNPFSRALGANLDQSYFGPPIVDLNFLRELVKKHTPSQIAQVLRLEIAKKESNYQFCHQSAWSRSELQDMLNYFGFAVVSFDSRFISDNFASVPGIYEMLELSMYCWAKKKPLCWSE